MNRIIKSLQKLVPAGLAASLILGAILVIPGGSVFAASGGQSSNPPAAQTPAPGNPISQKDRLQNRFEREQKLLAAQGNRINRATNLADRAQNLIDRALAKGWPVEVLRTALADFKTALSSATQIHANASQILTAHAGFDANGNVTDVGQARQTVLSAAESLLEAHQTLVNAFDDLLKEIIHFRQQVKPAQQASPAPTASQ